MGKSDYPEDYVYSKLFSAIERVIRIREERVYVSFVKPIFELGFKQFLEGQLTSEAEAIARQFIYEKERQFKIDQDVVLPDDIVLKKRQFLIVLHEPDDSVIQEVYQSDLKILDFRPAVGLQFAIITRKPDAVVIQCLYNFDPRIFNYLYALYFPKVEARIRMMGGNSNDAADLFQETIINIMKLVRNGQFKVNGSLDAYIIMAVRNNWLYKLRKESVKKIKTIPINDDLTQEYGDEQSIMDSAEPTDDFEEVSKWLYELSDKCMTLVKELVINKKTWNEIASEYGYKNAESARNQKYKCVEPLRKKFKEKGYRIAF